MLTAILAFHSPAGFVLPRQHLHATIAHLRQDGITTVVAQVVQPGQLPARIATDIPQKIYVSNQTLFYKENLWNLAARELTDADSLLFLDADVIFDPGGIRAAVERELETCDVCQQFEIAIWLGREHELTLTRLSAAEALAGHGMPRTGVFHPGFAWAMRRTAFDALGGWYDRQPCGGGDSAFAFALCPSDSTARPAWIDQQLVTMESPSFVEYKARANAANLRVGYVRGFRCCHRWHGDTAHRRYEQRNSMAPDLVAGEFPLEYRSDGLMQWTRGVDESRIRNYFRERREDG